MSEVLLVVLGRPEAAPGLLNAAARLTELVDCIRINVLAIYEPTPMSPLSAELLINEADMFLAEQAHERDRVEALKLAFNRWRDEAGQPASIAHWIEWEGSVPTVVAERGSRADIVITAAPADEDHLVRQAFKAALFGTGRPVLMVPPNASPHFGRTVAIAWRDDKQAARAIIPALRCLAGAEQVHVFAGVRDRAAPPVMPKILVEHGIQAVLHVLPIGSGSFGQTLLDKAHAVGADLLVMGAYAHSPLREMIFGGVTRYMLAHADLPILMRH